jgi:hypothetical protein
VVVALVEVPHDPVAALAVRAQLVVGALADHAEPVRVVDVKERVVLAGDAREGRDVRCVPGHAVHTVDADQPRRGAAVTKQPLQVVDVLERESLDRRPSHLGELAAVVNRLVRAVLQEDRPAAREHRDHRHVDQRDRRQHERVLGADQLGEPFLDLLVEDRAAEEARPARVRPPALEVLRDGGDDLAVEVEA